MRKMKRIFTFILILIGFVPILTGLVWLDREVLSAPERGTASLSSNWLNQDDYKDSEIVIFAVGDIVLDRGVEYMIDKKGGGNYRFPFLKIAEDLEEPDVLFGNLEGPISDQGEKVGSIYSFRMEPEAIEGLKYAGFDFLSLANNHAFDYQRIALEDTMDNLGEAGIDYVGAGFDKGEAFSVKVRKVNNTKIGFLAYTNLGAAGWQAGEERTGLAWIDWADIDWVKDTIRDAKEEVDVLFVSLHAGWEYSPEPNVFQQEFSKACIEAGADMVLGHHPHVIQEVEEYEGGWIAYSLGNFIFDQGFSEETMKGLLLEIIVANGRIVEVNPKEFKLSEYFQPYFP